MTRRFADRHLGVAGWIVGMWEGCGSGCGGDTDMVSRAGGATYRLMVGRAPKGRQ